MQAFVSEIRDWFEAIFVKNVPGRIGIKIRSFYWKWRFLQAAGVRMGVGCVISAPERICIGRGVNMMHDICLYASAQGRISIGDRVSMNKSVFIDAAEHGEIVIGNDVSIGPNVVIRASNHEFREKMRLINQQGHVAGKIVIEDDVWIAANVVIVPGVVIGKGAVIAAGAVVNKDVPAYSLCGGVPARVLRAPCRF
ncbi:MAG: acyltransferase [Candidatus Omnitrophota bacterium]